MSVFDYANKGIRKMNVVDMSLTKLAVFAFALMLAKIWDPILSLDWYFYAIIWVVAAIVPLYNFFKK